LSGSDALLLLEAIEACVEADDEVAFRTSIWPKIERLFDFRYATAALGRKTADRRGITIQRFVNYNVPDDICEAYAESGWETRDPVIGEHFQSFQMQYWSGTELSQVLLETGESRPIATNNPCCAVLVDCGIRSGYLCGIPPTTGNDPGSILCFSSGEGHPYDPRIDQILRCLLPHMHVALMRTANRGEVESQSPRLSGREYQVLNWLREGKSSWDISRVLGITERTVNFHVYNLLLKLGAFNRPQAVAIAMRRGLIPLN
jgi:DNA-binding CsgD family transcriptional regulator